MSGGSEFALVESPLIQQLVSMGYAFNTGNRDHASATGRESFSEVLIRDDMAKALKRINMEYGADWLDESRIAEAFNHFKSKQPKLMEANKELTELLMLGTSVSGLPGVNGGKPLRVHYIDWDHPDNNLFRVVNQFRVDCPSGQTKSHFIPDLVLFVNGIPLVVIECKDPGAYGSPQEAVAEGINQLRRYSNQRETDIPEGNEKLFHSVQIMVSTCATLACAGTIGGDVEHYGAWKDPHPLTVAELGERLGKTEPNSQEILAAGMLAPERLLDIVRHFTLFSSADGHVIKIVSRYQQYRAVLRAMARLESGKTREQAKDGWDHRGGLVWATQGSGKSFTMVFLVRRMRTHARLRKFKVVVVTDRTDLQRQLSETASTIGDHIQIAKKTKQLSTLLKAPGAGLLFAMIQKYRDQDMTDDAANQDEMDGSTGEDMGLCNPSEEILVLVDEAHRSHGSALHANLLKAIPNCARIGFTGTPILQAHKKKTTEIFGEYIDRYTLREAEADGAIVPILYEGRTSKAAVKDGRDLDELFVNLLENKSQAEIDALCKKYGTKGRIQEAEKLIEAKARDMLWHWVEVLLPGGLKAQVVAYSRHAAVLYQKAFVKARQELVDKAKKLSASDLAWNEEELMKKPRETRVAVCAHRYLKVIARMEFATIISGVHNDMPIFHAWTEPRAHRTWIVRFKKPLLAKEPRWVPGATAAQIEAAKLVAEKKTDPLAFLIVKSMLLTGFDAPIAGVMYLDRPIRDAELLQAIARVNRTRPGKQVGVVVDYYGMAENLREALAAYAPDDANEVLGALRNVQNELPTLRDRHQRIVQLFQEMGLDDTSTSENAVTAFRADERRLARFTVLMRQFLASLDTVLPRAEGLPYVGDAKRWMVIQALARKYSDEGTLIGEATQSKIRAIIDQHLISLGIDPRIAPTSITDFKAFEKALDKVTSPRAKASEMEHALRHHIRQHMNEHPEFYQKLSDRLDEIIKKLADQWEQLALALGNLIKDGANPDRNAKELDIPEVWGPFHGLLRTKASKELPTETLVTITETTMNILKRHVNLAGFSTSVHKQNQLLMELNQAFDDPDHPLQLPYEDIEPLSKKILETAKANDCRLQSWILAEKEA